MLKYIDSEKYKRDPRIIIHYVLIAICAAVIILGLFIDFH